MAIWTDVCAHDQGRRHEKLTSATPEIWCSANILEQALFKVETGLDRLNCVVPLPFFPPVEQTLYPLEQREVSLLAERAAGRNGVAWGFLKTPPTPVCPQSTCMSP